MTRNVVTRTLLVLATSVTLAALTVVGAALPAAAATGGILERDVEPTMVVVNGRGTVGGGQTVDDLWIVKGQALVRGRVEGDVVVLSGNATVMADASVGGDVTVLRGTVDIGAGAEIGGDVKASARVTVDEAAVVSGAVGRTSELDALRDLPTSAKVVAWAMLTVAVLGLGLLVCVALRRASGVLARVGREWPVRSSLWGVATVVMVPIMAALGLVTIVGGLLGVVLLMALGVALVVGLVATSLVLGRLVLRGTDRTVLALLVGAGLLRLAAWIPMAFELVTLPAAVFGLGALVVAVREATSATATDDEAGPVLVAARRRAAEDGDPVPGATDPIGGPSTDADWIDGEEEELFAPRVGPVGPVAAPAAADGAEAVPAPVQVFTEPAPAPVAEPTPVFTAPASATDPVPAPEPVAAGEDTGGWLSGLVERAQAPSPPVDPIDLRDEPEPEPDGPPAYGAPVVLASVPVRDDAGPVATDHRRSGRDLFGRTRGSDQAGERVAGEQRAMGMRAWRPGRSGDDPSPN